MSELPVRTVGTYRKHAKSLLRASVSGRKVAASLLVAQPGLPSKMNLIIRGCFEELGLI